MSDIQLSPDAHKRLNDELEDLTTRGRIEIANAIEKARAMGDLSENGDYHAAKDSQGHMESRIRKIQHILGNAEIVSAENSTVVSTGSVVELSYDGDDDVERYLIGSIEERPEDSATVMSPGSPLGQALMGRKVGETVEYDSPGGKLKVEIVSISS